MTQESGLLRRIQPQRCAQLLHTSMLIQHLLRISSFFLDVIYADISSLSRRVSVMPWSCHPLSYSLAPVSLLLHISSHVDTNTLIFDVISSIQHILQANMLKLIDCVLVVFQSHILYCPNLSCKCSPHRPSSPWSRWAATSVL